MNIEGLNKAEVLAVLYNRSKPAGMGFMHYNPEPMTTEQAQEILDSGATSFDYLSGRVMKINLSGDEVDTWGFNRDNGEDAAENAIAELTSTGDVNSAAVQEAHKTHTRAAAGVTKASLDEETTFESEGGVAHVKLGLSDMAEHLGPKVDRVIDSEEREPS